jgi:hypothetical protein
MQRMQASPLTLALAAGGGLVRNVPAVDAHIGAHAILDALVSVAIVLRRPQKGRQYNVKV